MSNSLHKKRIFGMCLKNKQKVDPFYSNENITHLKKAIRDLKEGKGVEHELIEKNYKNKN